ncbi:MAG TPA: class II aldolase/adducin family protein, partial [Alphaproteobacteria bacterium]|nr:class II aldolase/adducin family protein [Alphaproteobacteria bacterium]
MTVGAVPDERSVRSVVGEAEWKLRIDLAALYRLVALEGWDDLVFTHLSLRVPGPEHHFLINPFGMLFEEITASSLVKIDQNGEKVLDTPYGVNPAGFVIHSAVHMGREDAHCVMHLHTEAGVGVAAQEQGLLPISQHAMVIGKVAYLDYEGIAVDMDERARLVEDLGPDSTVMILRNHGTL